jgi:hypothetical protein
LLEKVLLEVLEGALTLGQTGGTRQLALRVGLRAIEAKYLSAVETSVPRRRMVHGADLTPGIPVRRQVWQVFVVFVVFVVFSVFSVLC